MAASSHRSPGSHEVRVLHAMQAPAAVALTQASPLRSPLVEENEHM